MEEKLSLTIRQPQYWGSVCKFGCVQSGFRQDVCFIIIYTFLTHSKPQS
jgi:hypothetical protein